MKPKTSKGRKAEQTRERLLQLALREFNRKGFEKVGMRDLAKAADLSLGAFYYHFGSKDEIVQVYYAETLEVFEQGAREIFAATRKFEERFRLTVEHRLRTFEGNREVIQALSRFAIDPRSELSPFGAGTREVRESAIRVFAEMLEGSDLKVHAELRPLLPELLWMVAMGCVLFWVFDTSEGQRQTRRFITGLSPLLYRLLRFTGQPMMGRFVRPWIDLYSEIRKRPT